MGSLPVGISGSRSAAILGLSKYTTQVEVWQSLCEAKWPGFNAERGLSYEPFTGNSSTEFGHCFESSVITLTEQSKGVKITDQEGAYSLDCETPITCHIDGRFSDSHIFEGKTVYQRGFDKSFGEPGTDRIPVEYQCQVQSNMLVTGAEQCTLSALVFPRSPDEWINEGWRPHKVSEGKYYLEKVDNEGAIIAIRETDKWASVLADMGFFHNYSIAAKPDVQKMMLEVYEDFWNRFILTKKPPEVTDYEDLRRLFPSPVGTLVVSDLVASQCREYKDIGKEIGSGGFLKKKQVQLKTDILKLCLTETTVLDDESQEKIILRDSAGNKCGSFDGKTFRA